MVVGWQHRVSDDALQKSGFKFDDHWSMRHNLGICDDSNHDIIGPPLGPALFKVASRATLP